MSLKILPKELENIINDYNTELIHIKNYNKYKKELKDVLKKRTTEYTIGWNHNSLELWCYSDKSAICLEERINVLSEFFERNFYFKVLVY